MWGPLDDDWAAVTAAALFLSPIVILASIVLIRGRMTDQERDMMQNTLPHIARTRDGNDNPAAARPEQALPTGEQPELEGNTP